MISRRKPRSATAAAATSAICAFVGVCGQGKVSTVREKMPHIVTFGEYRVRWRPVRGVLAANV